jgi:hypothetical protein
MTRGGISSPLNSSRYLRSGWSGRSNCRATSSKASSVATVKAFLRTSVDISFSSRASSSIAIGRSPCTLLIRSYRGRVSFRSPYRITRPTHLKGAFVKKSDSKSRCSMSSRTAAMTRVSPRRRNLTRATPPITSLRLCAITDLPYCQVVARTQRDDGSDESARFHTTVMPAYREWS